MHSVRASDALRTRMEEQSRQSARLHTQAETLQQTLGEQLQASPDQFMQTWTQRQTQLDAQNKRLQTKQQQLQQAQVRRKQGEQRAEALARSIQQQKEQLDALVQECTPAARRMGQPQGTAAAKAGCFACPMICSSCAGS